MVVFLGLACIIGGFLIVIPLFMEKNQGLKRLDEKVKPYKIIIGLAILIIGIIKFFAPYHGVGRPLIPIFGDFLPAILAILSGIFISVDFLESLQRKKEEEEVGELGAQKMEEGEEALKPGAQKMESFWIRTKSVLQRYQYPIGFASMFFGLLHWFIFRIVFF
jgi:hypothetical protein